MPYNKYVFVFFSHDMVLSTIFCFCFYYPSKLFVFILKCLFHYTYLYIAFLTCKLWFSNKCDNLGLSSLPTFFSIRLL